MTVFDRSCELQCGAITATGRRARRGSTAASPFPGAEPIQAVFSKSLAVLSLL
jgi:hypothetical protein